MGVVLDLRQVARCAAPGCTRRFVQRSMHRFWCRRCTLRMIRAYLRERRSELGGGQELRIEVLMQRLGL